MLTLYLFLATALIAAILISALLPLRVFFILSGVLATFQIYTIPLGGIFFSASHLGGLGAWRAFGERSVKKRPWVWLAGALILWQGISAIWSPNPYLALRQIFYWLPFIFIVPTVVIEARKDVLKVEKVISLLLLSTLVQVVLVAIFRFAPSVEASFLSSGFTGFFISPNILGELGNGAYTVSDPGKSGGFFVNANVAAVFMGMSAFFAWGFGGATKRKWPYWVATANWVAIFLTGSKAGAGIAVAFPLFAYGIYVYRAKKISIQFVATACFLTAAAVPVLIYGAEYFLASKFVANSSETFSYRLAIWNFAWQILMENPLTGIGFGGWEIQWPMYAKVMGLNPLFPPHNSLVALFAQSGILAVLMAVGFCLTLLGDLWRWGRRRDGVGALALAVFFCALWAFVQSLGENFGILGEVHITPLLALALGYLLYLNEKSDAL